SGDDDANEHLLVLLFLQLLLSIGVVGKGAITNMVQAGQNFTQTDFAGVPVDHTSMSRVVNMEAVNARNFVGKALQKPNAGGTGNVADDQCAFVFLIGEGSNISLLDVLAVKQRKLTLLLRG